MLSLLAALTLAAVPLGAQTPDDAPLAPPEQYPGQLARLRLAMLYPTPAPEPSRALPRGPQETLDAFLEDGESLLRDVDGLTAYLRAGLGDPAAIDGDRERWAQAWTRLDAEVARLAALVALGEGLLSGPVPRPTRRPRGPRGYVRLEDAPEFPGAEGARLHRAAVLAAYARNLREYLLRKGAQ